MGFALWIDSELARAQGLHEYRPLGVAAIAVTDRFRERDFNPGRPAPPRGGCHYAGLFASLGEVNSYLRALGRSQRGRKKSRRTPTATPAWI